MLRQDFVTEYVKLDTDRDAGANIWRLCEMSAEVVVPRGIHIDEKYQRKQENGDTLELAQVCRKNEDTIGRRAFAWRQWERFDKEELFDENGEELDYSHIECRQRLFYSHFAVLGQMVEGGEITEDTATASLIQAVKNNHSVGRMVSEIQEILEVEEYFGTVIWPKFSRKINSVLRYPQVVGRRRRLLLELVSTDWDAKESNHV